MTTGNSSNSTLALDDKLTYAWANADFNFHAGALRIQTSNDPFAVGTSGDFDIVKDVSRELDTERYYVSRDGWDKDTNAGVEPFDL